MLVVNVMGAVFMPALDDPFAGGGARALAPARIGNGCDAVVVDMHAEASSEKQTMGYFLDGKASLVIGTHTHVPTADCRILPGGTAFMTDVGMCGDYDSVIGMEKDEPLRRATTKIPSARFGPALGPAALSGLAVEIDDATGLARRVAPLRIGPGPAAGRAGFRRLRHERRAAWPLLLRRGRGSPRPASRSRSPGAIAGLPPADRRAGGRVGRLPRRAR